MLKIFLGSDDYDDEDDDEDEEDTDDEDDEEEVEEPLNDEPDYDGFSLLFDEFADSSETNAARPTKATRKVDQSNIAQSKVGDRLPEGSGGNEDPTISDGTATVLPSDSNASVESSTVKSKNSKKAKKFKKKTTSDADYAFDIINGIFDFFN